MHHELEKEDVHTSEQVKLMQSQDVKYINMKRVMEKRRIERLQVCTCTMTIMRAVLVLHMSPCFQDYLLHTDINVES